jgi:hypothetical protein
LLPWRSSWRSSRSGEKDAGTLAAGVAQVELDNARTELLLKRRAGLLALVLVAAIAATGSASIAHAGNRIAPRVKAILLALADREAAAHGDRHPYAINAVLTTVGQLEDLKHFVWRSVSPAWPLYVVAMRGRFRPPRGASMLPVRVITLGIPVETMRVELRSFSFAGIQYPKLRNLGAPVRLEEPRRTSDRGGVR